MLFSGKVDLNDLHDRDRAESAGEALGAGMVFAAKSAERNWPAEYRVSAKRCQFVVSALLMRWSNLRTSMLGEKGKGKRQKGNTEE